VTRLPDKIEDAIRLLDDQDSEAERVFMTEIAPRLPGIPEPPGMNLMRARELLERNGLANVADLLPEPRRKPGNPKWKRREWHESLMLDDIAEDARRLRRMGLSPSYARAGAAERHLRLIHGHTIGSCRCGSRGVIWVDNDELADLINELERWTSRGTSGAEMRRRKKQRRARN
jgi:hypothetical protein